jgi:hypothetical protein
MKNTFWKFGLATLVLAFFAQAGHSCVAYGPDATCESSGDCMQACSTVTNACGSFQIGVISQKTVTCGTVNSSATSGSDSSAPDDQSQDIPVLVRTGAFCIFGEVHYVEFTDTAHVTCIGKKPAGNPCNPVYASKNQQKTIGNLSQVLKLPEIAPSVQS